MVLELAIVSAVGVVGYLAFRSHKAKLVKQQSSTEEPSPFELGYECGMRIGWQQGIENGYCTGYEDGRCAGWVDAGFDSGYYLDSRNFEGSTHQ